MPAPAAGRSPDAYHIRLCPPNESQVLGPETPGQGRKEAGLAGYGNPVHKGAERNPLQQAPTVLAMSVEEDARSTCCLRE